MTVSKKEKTMSEKAEAQIKEKTGITTVPQTS